MRTPRWPVSLLLVAFVVVCMACGGRVGPLAPAGDMTLKEFILQKPAGVKAVRVDCKLDTYYNYSFSRCAETHYSFNINGGSFADSAHVYAPKNSEQGRRLYEMLKNGSEQEVTLRIQRIGPEGDPLPARDDSCFALIGIVDAKK